MRGTPTPLRLQACRRLPVLPTHRYIDFEPQYYYWRLALLMRKMALITVTIMFTSNAMFQVCVLGRFGFLRSVSWPSRPPPFAS